MRVSLDIEGLDDMISQLERKGKDMQKVTPKALRAGGRVLAQGMKDEVPVSDIDHVHIRDDIKVRQTPKKTGRCLMSSPLILDQVRKQRGERGLFMTDLWLLTADSSEAIRLLSALFVLRKNK